MPVVLLLILAVFIPLLFSGRAELRWVHEITHSVDGEFPASIFYTVIINILAQGPIKNKFLAPFCLVMTMDNRPPVLDHSLLFPFLIGIVSLLGIGFLLVSVWFPREDTLMLPTQTVTPFKYLFLGTETVVPTPEPETAAPLDSYPDPDAPSAESMELLPVPTEQSGTPEVVLLLTLPEQTENGISTEEFFTPTFTITPAPIFAGSVPMTAGMYDGADPHIIRSGSWTNQSSVNAYQGTLLVSNTVGNYLAFSFVGHQMALGYEGNDNAGNLMVNIDGSEVPITQRVGNSWFSQELIIGTHFVILTHISGNTVNLDYIDILE
jgi:hypothetical protein